MEGVPITVTTLRAKCQQFKLPLSGKKLDLIQRLVDCWENQKHVPLESQPLPATDLPVDEDQLMDEP